MIIRYREVDGQVEKQIIASGDKILMRGEQRPDRHFSATLLKAYQKLENEHGSRFKSTYSKSQIKATHDTALARFDQLGQDT